MEGPNRAGVFIRLPGLVLLVTFVGGASEMSAQTFSWPVCAELATSSTCTVDRTRLSNDYGQFWAQRCSTDHHHTAIDIRDADIVGTGASYVVAAADGVVEGRFSTGADDDLSVRWDRAVESHADSVFHMDSHLDRDPHADRNSQPYADLDGYKRPQYDADSNANVDSYTYADAHALAHDHRNADRHAQPDSDAYHYRNRNPDQYADRD